MAKQIVWVVKAKNELISILRNWFNRKKSKTFSIKLNKLFEEQIKLVSEFPNISRKTDIKNVRVIVIQKYLVYFEIQGNILYILSIRHGRRNKRI